MSFFKTTSLKSKNSIKGLLLAGALSLSFASSATVVEVQTNYGNFQINLFDEATPQTVENFLSYVNAGAYANNVVHRSVPGFVVQAGGFQYNNVFPPGAISTSAPVPNEPELSNVRATIAMAKVGGNPNSATSQWFINLVDNSANLDVSNGGFTVFGQVLGDGMDVVDAIVETPRFNFSGAFSDLPLRDITANEINAGTDPDETNLVIITDIVVVDSATVTNPDLNPAPNTLIDAVDTPDSSDGGSSGGATGALMVSFMALVALFRRRKFDVKS